MKNALLGHLLAERGWTQARLAAHIGSGRAHVSQVLNNVPGRGHRTRKKLAPLLTQRELDLLGWTATGTRARVFPVERSKSSENAL